MKVYFARHGRTNYNELGLCNADPDVDVHLTEQGISQAHTLAAQLKLEPIDRIFISELPRTRQTADIVNQFHHVPVEADALLNDQRSGYEGKPAQHYFDALDAAPDRWNARFNDGESIEEMKQRVALFIGKLKIASCESPLVVTSQWIIHAAVSLVEDLPNQEAWALEVQPGNCLELEI